MYWPPQEGDRVQDFGSSPAHGILLTVEYDDRAQMEIATVLWDNGREGPIPFEMLEVEHPR